MRFFTYLVFGACLPLFICLFSGCEKLELKKEIALATGMPAFNNTSRSFEVEGKIIDAGEGIVRYGHAWSLSSEPVLREPDLTRFDDASGPTAFVSALSRLEGEKAHYVWAYAITKNNDTIFSEPTSFTPPFDAYLEMVFVEGGTFKMGSESGQCACERPVHDVSVNSFYIMKFEVTQALWEAVNCSGAQNRSGNQPCPKCPVETLTWLEAQDFIKCLNEKTNKKFRLPTEAEWEYAARGGKKSKGFEYSGSNSAGEVGWLKTNTLQTREAGLKKSNELGLFDMTGNVNEFCSDWYDENYYRNSPSSNPKGPSTGQYKVCKGGSFTLQEFDVRSAVRLITYGLDYRCFDCGFRLVLDNL